jgi:hypothetical protein
VASLIKILWKNGKQKKLPGKDGQSVELRNNK